MIDTNEAKGDAQADDPGAGIQRKTRRALSGSDCCRSLFGVAIYKTILGSQRAVARFMVGVQMPTPNQSRRRVSL